MNSNVVANYYSRKRKRERGGKREREREGEKGRERKGELKNMRFTLMTSRTILNTVPETKSLRL